MTTYRVKDWDEYFEISQSRKAPKRLTWVALPNKHDGKGYRRVSQHPRSSELFCAWVLIVQVASKMEKRGLLVDRDGPLDADDLSAKTGFPIDIFVLALEELVNGKIGWMEVVDE